VVITRPRFFSFFRRRLVKKYLCFFRPTWRAQAAGNVLSRRLTAAAGYRKNMKKNKD